MKNETMTLTDNTTGKSCDLPILRGTEGDPTVQVGTLNKDTGYFTYDPSFNATASCSSAITFIDGDVGILRHRGYPIEQLAAKSSYMEVVHLLLYGELPNKSQLGGFSNSVKQHTMIHESLQKFISGFHYDAHPMAMMIGVVGSLSAFYHESIDIDNAEDRDLAAKRLIGKMPTIAAACYKHSIGQPMVYPDNSCDYSENFLQMMFSVPCEEYQVSPVAKKAIDLLLILHADHEQNASTSTVRMAGSSGANPFACVAAGMASLWGPSHGGANEAVLNMLGEIGDESKIDQFLAKAKDKNDPFRLMGFGHRVYKSYDPRATLVHKVCEDVLASIPGGNQLLELAMRLEEKALNDDYFVERKLFPNVDFYSGIIYQALGVPVNMFTVMFGMSRTAGWMAHWNEMISEPGQRISRPRQLYTGATMRDYVDIEKR